MASFLNSCESQLYEPWVLHQESGKRWGQGRVTRRPEGHRGGNGRGIAPRHRRGAAGGPGIGQHGPPPFSPPLSRPLPLMAGVVVVWDFDDTLVPWYRMKRAPDPDHRRLFDDWCARGPYSDKKKELKISRKSLFCVAIFFNCVLMVQYDHPQRHVLPSRDLPTRRTLTVLWF